MFGLDIDGFLESPQFLAQLAGVIAAIITGFLSGLLLPLFGQA